jgi:serine/threonine protein kinase
MNFSSHRLETKTEFLDQGSLYSYLHSDAKIDANVLMNFTKGISAGMLHLHREGIIHRDLAARNILVTTTTTATTKCTLLSSHIFSFLLLLDSWEVVSK